MTLARALMARVWDRRVPVAPAAQPPAAPTAHTGPNRAPVPHPAPPAPSQAHTGRGMHVQDGPTDQPPGVVALRWWADEAEALARLADLTAWCRDPRYAADLWFGDNR